jgi:regulatory protein
VHGREGGGPDGEVTVARLDGIGAGRADAPVARFGTALPEGPGHVPADLGALGESESEAAPVAALGDGPAEEPGRASTVALFDAEQLTAAREDVQVATLGGAGARRRTVAPRRETSTGDGEPGGRPSRGARRRTAGRSGPARPAAGDDPPGEADAPAAAESSRRERGRTRSRNGRSELDPDVDPVAAAREICLRLLTDRARTRQELAQALSRRGVPDEAAGVVLERFDEVGLIDDAAFAGQWVRSRHNQRGLARRAIAFELRRKGVSDEDAGEALAEVDAESEEQRARELVERKLRSLAVATTEQRAAAARRLVGMLARKGYGAGVAYRVVKDVLAERGAEAEELGDAEPPDD